MNDWEHNEKYVTESLDSIKTRLTAVEKSLTEQEVNAVKMEARIQKAIGKSEAKILAHIDGKLSGYQKLEAKFYAYSGGVSLVMAGAVGAAFKYLLD